MRLVFAEKTTVFGFDSNDSIHSNQITNRMATWLSQKDGPLTFILSPKGREANRMTQYVGRRPRNDGLGSRRLAGAVEQSASPFAKGEDRGEGLPSSFTHDRMRKLPTRRRHRFTDARKKAQRAKHTSDPISPAPGTLLSTALLSGICNST